MDDGDLRLIRDAKRGDLDAFATLVHNYKDFVVRTAYGVVHHHADAEDIAQEVFLKVHQSFATLRDERTFPSWLARITVRKSLDWLDKERRRPAVPLEAEHAVADPNQSTADRLDVAKAVANMSPPHRAVLVLREVHGFDYRDLARILNIPLGTVRSRLHQARMQLREFLQDGRGDE